MTATMVKREPWNSNWGQITSIRCGVLVGFDVNFYFCAFLELHFVAVRIFQCFSIRISW
jgi:hypothetical protein